MGYSLEQAVSDEAQLHTIAFNGLAFLTGDFGACTFLPPGKVCDFFGFQYMRDIDATGMGHNPKFLDRVADNVFSVLSPSQLAAMKTLAKEQADPFQELAQMRWSLIKAFCEERDGERPTGSPGLDSDAVSAYVGEIFALDAKLSYARAKLFGEIARSLSPQQKAYLGKMRFGDFRTWPEVAGRDVLGRGWGHLEKVLCMTYASEFFSWYAGSTDADTYFCPERHGTYFGGFYMKDMPAMGKHDYNISTSLTGDSGQAFLDALDSTQRQQVVRLIAWQHQAMTSIVVVRRQISTKLRGFLSSNPPELAEVVALGRQYGELDGKISCAYATAFASVNRTLTGAQRQTLVKLRNLGGYRSAQAYVYSQPYAGALGLVNADRFFALGAKDGR